jgi:hypothetical protein
MADEQSDPPNKRRRPPTTIDAKATEVASEATPPSERVDPVPESAPPEQAAAAPEPDTPASEEVPPADVPPGPPPERTGRARWPMLGGGIAALVAVAVLLALWLGAFRTDDPNAARLASLERQVRDLANRPQSPAADPRAVAELTTRVGAAEQALGKLSELDARVAKLESAAAAPRAAAASDQALAELKQNIDAAGAAARDAKSRADEAFNAAQKAQAPAVSPAELQALATRVASLEQATKAAEQKLAVTAGADRAGRLAFIATTLRGAVERGDPFTNELAAVKPLVPDAGALAPLEPFAATGVPRSAALARELSQVSGAMLSAAGTAPREGGFLDRIQQNAERLVRIRPISETPGDDAATVIARADAKASHGDIAGAVTEVGTLPPAVRAPAEAWIKKAQAQIAALAAARKLADDALGTLSKATP